jgi:hypothetical protein
VPVVDINKVLAQQDVFNEDVIRMIDALVLNFQPGDYDFNGTVNAADYDVWKSSYGSTTNAAADGNGNGKVDAADYVIWRNTLGLSGGPGAGAGSLLDGNVPEPTGVLLVLVGSLLAALPRRRRG